LPLTDALATLLSPKNVTAFPLFQFRIAIFALKSPPLGLALFAVSFRFDAFIDTMIAALGVISKSACAATCILRRIPQGRLGYPRFDGLIRRQRLY